MASRVRWNECQTQPCNKRLALQCVLRLSTIRTGHDLPFCVVEEFVVTSAEAHVPLFRVTMTVFTLCFDLICNFEIIVLILLLEN